MDLVFVLILATSITSPWSQAQISETGDIITSFLQDPPGVVIADSRVVYSCQALGRDVSWSVNGIRINNSTSTDALMVTSQSINATTINSILTVTRAKANENNTEIVCIVEGANPNLTYNRTTHLLIAAPPLPPFLRLEVFANGSGLRAQWYRPFTMEGYPVTSYTLTFVNKSNGDSFKEILEDNLPSVTFDLTISDFPMNCHPITYSLFATNSVGESSLSTSVTLGFPIFPRTDNVVLHVNLNILPDGSPILTTTFQAPTVCTYQEPARYTVDIIDDRGNLVNSTGLLSVNASNDYVSNTLYATLERGHTYSAELTILHEHVPGEAFATFLGIEYPFLESTTTTKSKNTVVRCSELMIILAIILTTSLRI